MERVGAPGSGRGLGRGGRIGRLLAIAVALASVAAVLALATALASAVTERHASEPVASGPGGHAGPAPGSGQGASALAGRRAEAGWAAPGTEAAAGSGGPGMEADTQRVRAPGAREIVLDFDSGRLDLEAAPAGVATATVERRWSGRPPTLRHRFEGGVLRIVSRCPQPRRSHADRCRVHGRVGVPDGTRVRAEVDAGDVTATAVHGDLELNTSAGAVHVARLVGPVQLRADVGTIAAEDLRSPSFLARSGTGNLTASFLQPPSTVDATTGAGTVQLAVPPASYAVDASAGIGLVSVDVPDDPAAPRHILARAAVGQVRISPR